MKDFVVCPDCEALLIVDEFETHECTPNYRLEGDYLFTRRKGRWRRIKLSSLGITYQPKGNTLKNSTEDETEPSSWFCLIYGT